MGLKRSPQDIELYRRTDEALFYIWDPIGVSDAPMARDEYQSYLPDVFNLLKENSPLERISEYLFEIETHQMGLQGDKQKDIEVAKLLLEWKKVISEKQS